MSVRRMNGFSLIELLAVIAIILLLTGILFPIVSGAQKKVKTSKCMTNLKEAMVGNFQSQELG